jgi:hypothetical protein
MSSVAEAREVAYEHLRTVLANIRSGTRTGGYYPRAPLREPILNELMVDSEQALVVTRNRYGAEILNTDRILIADIDLPGLAERVARNLLRRLFGRSSAGPHPAGEPAAVVDRLATLTSWADANPGLGVLVYRTASGLRVFVTGIVEPASSVQGEQVLAELGADPIYRELCRTHGTFRARLTPKPWRLPNMQGPPGRWPREEGRAERRFQRWLTKYETAAREYAVCRRLLSRGPAPSTLEAQIVQLHDDRTRVQAPLPLA